MAFAGKSDGKNAEKAKTLGDALAHMADEPEDEKADAKAE